jgi:ABC-type multidrug transport system fused ATPase/permease subunit
MFGLDMSHQPPEHGAAALIHPPLANGKSPNGPLDKLFSRLLGHTIPLLPIAARNWWTIPVVVVGGLLASLLEGLGIGLLIPLLATLSSDPGTEQGGLLGLLNRFPLLLPPEGRLAGLAGIILACVVCKGLLQAGTAMLVGWIEGRVARDLRSRLAARLLDVGYPFFLATGQARLLNILATDSWRASEAVHFVFDIIGAAATILVFGALLLFTNWQLFLVTAAGAAVIRVLQSLVNRRVARIGEHVQLVNLELAQRMILLAFDMAKLVRLFNQQEREAARFETASERLRRVMHHLSALGAWAAPLSETLYAVLFLAILIGAHATGVALPVLIAFLLLMYRMQPFIAGIGASGVAIASVAGSVREVEWLLRATDAPPPRPGLPFTGLACGIRFERVGFAYATARGTEVLDGVSFDIEAGRWTALAGASGRGKSTIVNLLGRLLSPTSGAILVDGVDLEAIDCRAWRSRLSVAGQDVELFAGTIAENIAFGAPDATHAEIVAAAAIADADALIAAMPQGYDTLLGEGGLSLSGGQRQRLGLARALVRRPELLILDEAMNALDVDSEAAVMARLRAISAGMTVLVVSHRASTLAYCDRMVDLGAGQSTEAPAPAY